MSEQTHRYIVALGGNVRHHRYGAPKKVISAAMAQLDQGAMQVLARSRIIQSKPLGPSRRTFANAAVIVAADMNPREFLAKLKELERAFGRRHGGSRWSARTLDCDIVLWSEGMWCDSDLAIPHVSFRERDFVLLPVSQIAPGWRDPLTGMTTRQLLHRLRSQAA